MYEKRHQKLITKHAKTEQHSNSSVKKKKEEARAKLLQIFY